MKIYTKVDFVWDKELGQYVEESSESYEYEGEVAEAKGGGGEEVTETKPWAEQAPYLQDLFGKAQDWQQRTPADVSQAQDYTQRAATGMASAAEAVSPYMQSVMQANQGYATGDLLDVYANPALQGYVDATNQAIMRQFTEGVMPQISSSAAAVGGIGSSRQGIAEGLGAGRAMEAVGRNTAGLLSTAYGQGLQATMQAQSMAPGLAKAQGIAPGFLAGAGDLSRMAATYEDQQELQRLKDYQALISGNYGGTVTGPAQYESGPGLGSIAGGVIGGVYGGTAGASLGASLGSYFD